MDKPGSCDCASNDANAEKSLKLNPTLRYWPTQVDVVESTDKTITFVVPGSNKPTTKYVATWDNKKEIWPACPSSLPSNATADNAGAPAVAGTSGILYLSEPFLVANPLIPHLEPKWPRNLPGGMEYKPIRIAFIRLTAETVHIADDGTTRFGEQLELLDFSEVEPGHGIGNDGNWLTLNVTELGRSKIDADPTFDGVTLEKAVALILERTKDLVLLSKAWRVIGRAAASPRAQKDAATKAALARVEEYLNR